MNDKDFRDLIPAYVLGALDPDERAEVESWAASDAETQRLLVEYQAVADGLLFTTPARSAPPHLADDLRRRLSDRRPAAPTRSIRRTLPLRVLVLAAGLIVLLGAVLLWAATRSGSPPEPAQQYAEIAALEDALRLPVVPGDVEPGVWGELVATADGRQAVIEVSGLPELTPDQSLQLWLVEGDHIESGGLFWPESPDEPLYIPLPLDMPITDYRAFGVSLEPAGGSPLPEGPSGPRVFSVPIDL